MSAKIRPANNEYVAQKWDEYCDKCSITLDENDPYITRFYPYYEWLEREFERMDKEIIKLKEQLKEKQLIFFQEE